MRPTSCSLFFALSCSAGCGGAAAVVDHAVVVSDVELGVNLDGGFDVFRAFTGGAVIGVVEGDHLVLQRLQGEGSALHAARTPVAARRFYDVDERGNLYVEPFEVVGRGPVSTLLPDSPFGDTVTRVSPDNEFVNLVNAGRGIWEFGVAPDGDALWVTACGPNGIFEIDEDGAVSPGLAPPDSLWEQRPAVLTGKDTFWSVGVAGEYALVKADGSGARDVGATAIDFGRGAEEGVLARCGRDVCGVFGSAVVVYGSDGSVVFTVDHDDVAGVDERLDGVSGTDSGLYLTITGASSRRVVFVAR